MLHLSELEGGYHKIVIPHEYSDSSRLALETWAPHMPYLSLPLLSLWTLVTIGPEGTALVIKSLCPRRAVEERTRQRSASVVLFPSVEDVG